jgi:hypothetical protein
VTKFHTVNRIIPKNYSFFYYYQLDAFDREYNNVYQKLNEQQRQLINDFDKCPSLTTVMCRRLFSSLEL